jgi:branched-chain amino acid transport system ATP-binding protein/nonpolar-amino-acid-transporting ATPase
VLRLRAIHHSFRGLQVLKGVDLEVPDGAFVGLIGPNGAGKSTLFNIATGYLRADAGAVEYRGEDLTRSSVQARTARGLVRSFQTPKVFAQMSVLENVMVGRHRHGRGGVLANMLGTGFSRRAFRRTAGEAEALLLRFGLSKLARHSAGLLPAGQQRMLELARAYAAQPSLLLLDEPSSGLNSEEIEQLKRVLRELNGEGIGILLVSHDMDLVRVAAEVSVLCFGEIIARGAMAQVQQDPRVREAYLGT